MKLKILGVLTGLIFCLQVQAAFATVDQGAEDRLKAFAQMHKPIVVGDLQLYKFLFLIKTNVSTALKNELATDDQGKEQKIFLTTASKFVAIAMKRMEHIVDDFNRGCFYCNPEIEYRFVNTCNLLDVNAPIEPCHLREQGNVLRAFNQYIITFCINPRDQISQSSRNYTNPGDYLSKEDRALADKIVTLNEILVSGLLNGKFLSLDVLDWFIDYVVYRPLEFIQNNESLVATLAVFAVATVGGYYAVISMGKTKT